jgi:creatinine amidohydrolase
MKKKKSEIFQRSIKTYEELTLLEVEDSIKANSPVMIPIGATEQHGEHLPLGTDTMVGIEIVKRASALLAKEKIPLLMGPVIPFGLRPFLVETPKDYPGTVNLSSTTFQALLEEVCSELIRMGFGTIYLLGGHAENDAATQLVAKELTESTPANVIALNWIIGIRSRYKGILKSTREEGHGGEGETARMLATSPHLVNIDRAQAYHPKPAKGPKIEEDRLPYLGGGIGRYRPHEGMFSDKHRGIIGNPGLATAETGEKVYGLISDWIVKIVKKEWIESSRKKGSKRNN